MENKTQIRKEMLRRRRLLSPSNAARASKEICDKIIASDEYKDSRTLLLYMAVNNEVSLHALSKAAKSDGKLVAYPLCLKRGEMSARVPNFDGVFNIGAYSIPEPDPENSRLIAPEDIDLVVCPLAAFDDKCRRLGMGGGYYDRFLPKCKNAFIAGAAYELQLVAEVPLASHDIVLDAVFTEKSVYRGAR